MRFVDVEQEDGGRGKNAMAKKIERKISPC